MKHIKTILAFLLVFLLIPFVGQTVILWMVFQARQPEDTVSLGSCTYEFIDRNTDKYEGPATTTFSVRYYKFGLHIGFFVMMNTNFSTPPHHRIETLVEKNLRINITAKEGHKILGGLYGYALRNRDSLGPLELAGMDWRKKFESSPGFAKISIDISVYNSTSLDILFHKSATLTTLILSEVLWIINFFAIVAVVAISLFWKRRRKHS